MEEGSKINDELMERINAFGKAVLESDEYRNLLQCDEALNNDKEAQDLLRDFRLKQLELRKGFDREVLGELNEMEERLKKNETLSNLESSQRAIADLFKSSNDLISEKIGMSFAQVRGGCR